MITAYLVAKHMARGKKGGSSSPADYGLFTATWMFMPCVLAAVVVSLLGIVFKKQIIVPDIMIVTTIVAVPALVGAICLKYFVRSDFKAREHVEKIIRSLLLIATLISVVTTVAIVISIFQESLKFFAKVSVTDFLFGQTWDPGAAFSESVGAVDEGAPKAQFGLLPLFWGSFYITLIALVVSIPIGLFSAVHLSEFASKPVRVIAKPTLEILAGIPTVVYGFFAALTVGPMVKDFGDWLNEFAYIDIPVDGMNALAPGIVMGIMIIPFVSSLSDDVINSVPNAMREGSLALGATQSETVAKVIVPAAMPGIISAIVLAFSRAIGETMIVVMAAGGNAKITGNPFEGMTTVTVKIVEALTGDTAFDNPATLVAFALGLVLFVVTLVLNYFAVVQIRKYRRF